MPYNYLEEEDQLLPLIDEDEENLPQIGRPMPRQISPELRRIISGSSRPPGEAFEVAEAKRKNDAYAEAVGQRPDRPKPKWWQKLGAIGFGAAAGYSNASGRRGQPIDIEGGIEGIVAPGHSGKMADWQGKVQAAGVERDTAERNRDAWWKGRQNQSTQEVHDAQIENYRSLAERNQALADAAATKRNRVQLGNTLWEEGDDGKWSKVADGSEGSQLKTLEQIATSVVSDSKLTPEQKQAKLKEIGDAYSALHPEKPVIHWATGKDGTVTAVTTTASEVAKGGGKKGFGQIGKPEQSGDGPAGSFTPIVTDTGEIATFFNPTTGKSVAPPVPGRRSPLSPTENVRRATLSIALEDLTKLEGLSEKYKDRIGAVKGRMTDVQLQTIGEKEPEVAEMFRISYNLQDQLARARSGAAITEHEYDRLKRLVPDPTTPYSTFRANLKSYKGEMSRLAPRSTGGKVGADGSMGGGQKIAVTAPDGSVHKFDTQAEADTFKKLAGIQ